MTGKNPIDPFFIPAFQRIASAFLWFVPFFLNFGINLFQGITEDASRKTKDNETENFNMLPKATMTLLVNDKTQKFNKKRKRLQTALDLKYREKLLGF